MVHVYSYYLGLSNMERYKDRCTVDLDTVANTLGISRVTIKRYWEQMNDLGLLEVQENKYRKNAPHVKLLVDFSKEQPEEAEYLAEKARATEEWRQSEERRRRETEENNKCGMGRGWRVSLEHDDLNEQDKLPVAYEVLDYRELFVRLISKRRRWAHTGLAARGSSTRKGPRNKIASSIHLFLELVGRRVFLWSGREGEMEQLCAT